MTSQPQSLGAYELLERIGTGGMGTVYKARDRRTGGIVAVKVIHDYLTTDPTIRQRFRQEAHIASLLTSPYTVRLQEYGEDNGRYYMASEFIDGVALSDILKQGPIEPAQALAIAAQVGMALHEAEARSVIHRDIKPSNIMITRSDQAVKVTDFGISRVAYGPDITQPGTYLGTLAYSAPEQLRGEPDIRSDFYAVGVTLYQCLTGEVPFQGNTPFVVAAAVEQTPPPIERLSHLPGPVVDLIAKCLRKDPAERYQTAAELGAAIEAARKSIIAAAPADSWVADQTAILAQTRLDAIDAPGAVTGMPPSISASIPSAPSQSGVAGEPPPRAPDLGAAPASGGPSGPAIGTTTAGAAGGFPRPLLFALAGGGAVIAAIIAIILLLGGNDEDGPTVLSPTATATRTVTTGTGTPRATATRPPVTATRPPATSTPRPPVSIPPPLPTVVSDLGPAPPRSFENGLWTFTFQTLANNCATGPLVGETLTIEVTLTEQVTTDGYISNGETAYLYDSDGMTFLGEAVFTWPALEVVYPLTDGSGTGYFYGEFFDANSGWGRLEALRFIGVNCSRLFEEARPPGFVPLFER